MILARKNRSGFTLVEVLASLAIIVIVLPTAMEAISLSTRTVSRARRDLEAANLAASKLAELVATNAWQSGNSSGDFSSYSTNFPDYTWTCQVTAYQEATAGAATTTGTGTSLANVGSGTSLGNAGKSGTSLGSTSSSAGSSTPGGTTTLGVTLEELDVTVSWPARNTTDSITVSTLVYPGS